MRGAEDPRRGVEKTLCDLCVFVVNNLGTIETSLFSHTWLRHSPRWILRGEHSLSGDPPGCFRLLAGKSPPMKAKFRYHPSDSSSSLRVTAQQGDSPRVSIFQR